MRTIGIDFGTTKTLVSWFNSDTNRVELVRLGQRGTDKIPTSVYVASNGNFLFGEDADDMMEIDALNYKRAFKMELGKSIPSLVVKINGENKKYSALDLTREFLKYIKQRCENEVFMGEKISRAVVTIPVMFSPAQQKDLRKAVIDAGFESVQLLPEPEAAGLAFAQHNPTNNFKTMMVVDCGGGTVDFALVSKDEHDEIHVCPDSFDGDENIGGEIFDDLLWQFASNKMLETDTKGRDPNQEPIEFLNLFRKQVRIAKERLSRTPQTMVIVAGSGGPYSTSITQEEFSNLINEQVNNIADKLDHLLVKIRSAYGKSPDGLLMIGGSSSIPAIQKALHSTSGLQCIPWQYTHEAVAIGASLFFDKLQKNIIKEEQSENEQKNDNHQVVNSKPSELNVSLFDILENPSKIAIVQSGVEEGNSDAQYLLGDLFFYSIVEKQDYRKAYDLYSLSAQQGNLHGIIRQARCLLEGAGVKISTQEAAQCISPVLSQISQLAQDGDSDCRYALGYIFDSELVEKRDEHSSFSWLNKAASQNHLEAMYKVGEYYFNNEDPQNYDLAFKIFNNLGKIGFPPAYIRLSECYELGEGVIADEEKMHYYLIKASESGLKYASWLLALNYNSSDSNDYKAQKLFETSIPFIIENAQNGSANFQYDLGMAYAHGLGVDKNQIKAFEWFKKAADQKDEVSMVEVAQRLIEGNGVTKDPSRAIDLLNEDCLADDSEALSLLGKCYKYGCGVSFDEDKAISLLEKSLELDPDNAQSKSELGEIYFLNTDNEFKQKKGFELLESVAEKYPRASYYVATGYELGIGVNQSIDKFIEYSYKAAQAGDIDATYKLGNYLSGTDDISEGIRYLQLAAEQNQADANSLLGTYFWRGHGVNCDWDISKNLLYKAASLGNNDAYIKLFCFFGICSSDKERNFLMSLKRLMNQSLQFDDPFYVLGKIPQDKISNALTEYANYIHPDTVIALYDHTFWGSAKRGFLVTYAGIVAFYDSDIESKFYPWWGIENLESFLNHDDVISINGDKLPVDVSPKALVFMFRKIINAYNLYVNQYYI